VKLQSDVSVGAEAEVVVHDVNRQSVNDAVISWRSVGHWWYRPCHSWHL